MDYKSFLKRLAGIKPKKKNLAVKIASRSIGTLVKIFVMSFVGLIITFAIPIIITLLIVITISFVFIQVQQGENAYVDQQQSQQGEYPSDFPFVSFSSTGESGNFNPTLGLPHGIPMSGRLTQGMCSNFYWSARGRIGYPSSGPNVAFENNCRTAFQSSPIYKDFAQRYAGGNWNRVGAHGGVDIAGAIGIKVYSMAFGKVVKVSNSKSKVGWGSYVDVYSEYAGEKYVIRYAHLSSVSVELGEIYAGQQLGLSGNTGNSTGPHLHLGICKGTNNFDRCYTSDGTVVMEEALAYMLNYRANGDTNSVLYMPTAYVGKNVFSGTGNPGLKLPNFTPSFGGSSFAMVNPLDKLDEQKRDLVYYQVGKQENVHPLILKALHYRERGLGLTNPTPRSDAGYSGHNEGVYGMYSDFSSLTPYCDRTLENFGGFGDTLTVREFTNQTSCAAKVIKHKFGNRTNLLTFETFGVDTQTDKEQFCNGLSGYNAGPFYCWNNLYPTHSSNSTYQNMPVYARGRLLGYHKQDGFLKFILDNKESYEYSLESYLDSSI